jgi:phage-related protein
LSEREIIVRFDADISGFRQAMGQLESELNGVRNEVGGAMNDVQTEVNQSAGGIKNALKGIGAAIAAAFAVDAVVGFGKTILGTTADIEALNSQYSQVMGGMKDDTDKYLGDMSKAWGKHPNELKKTYMQYVAILKSKGVAEGEAHNLAKGYLNATVDANAFANESMEDTTARFMGGIKGEYDSLDTAMVNLSATMMNDIALKEYGKKFDELSVAQQEQLKVQEAVRQHTSAGVVGQGEREAGSYANTVANLKNTWSELLAQFGSPILEFVNDKLKGLTSMVDGIDIKAVQEGFGIFGSYMKDTFGPALEDLKNGLQFLWDKFKETGGLETAKSLFEGFKDTLGFIKENAELVTATLGGLAGAFFAFNIITGINNAIGVFTKLIGALRTGTLLATLAQWGFNTALLANPITWIAIAIGALIAIVILLWKNWDTVSKWLSDSWAWIKDVAKTTWDGIKSAFSTAMKWIAETATSVWNGIKSFFSGIWNGIKSMAANVFNGIASFLSGIWNNIKTTASNTWNGIKTGITNVWEGIKSGISNAIDGIKGTITGLWTKASEIAGKIKSAFGNLFGGIKVPKFSISNASLNPKDWITKGLPKLNISWHANGGIVKGSNGGTVVGVGENGGDEAIVPLSNKSRMRPFAEAIAGMIGGGQQSTNAGPIINLTLNYNGAGSEEDAKDMLDIVERGLNSRYGTKLRMNGVRAQWS